jgi:hypothetical protein
MFFLLKVLWCAGSWLLVLFWWRRLTWLHCIAFEAIWLILVVCLLFNDVLTPWRIRVEKGRRGGAGRPHGRKLAREGSTTSGASGCTPHHHTDGSGASHCRRSRSVNSPWATTRTHHVAVPFARCPLCHIRFSCQNQVLIICMIQDQLFHIYSQKCS